MKETSLSNTEGIFFAVNRPLRRFGQDALRYLPSKLIPAATAFAGVVIFTHLFTPGAYGIYSLVVSIIAPAVVVVTEWAAQPVGRFFSEYERQGELDVYRSTLGVLLAVVAITGCIAGIGLFIFVSHFWGLSIGLAAGCLLLIESLYSLLLPIIPASLDSRSYRFLEVTRALLRLGLSLGLIFLLGTHTAILVWGLALGSAVLLPFLFQRVSKKIGRLKWSSDMTPHVHRFAQYGMPMMLWFFATQLLNVGDRYVLQAFRGSSEVGIYSANYNLATGAAGILGAPITLAAFPIIMYLWAGEGNREKIQKTISSVTEWYLLLAIGILGCTLVVARGLVSLLLGQAFQEGYSVLVPVLAGQILWHASILGHKGLELTENTKIMLKWACVAAIANFGLNMLFVPGLGYTAAAYTTLFSYGLYAFLIWRSSKHYIRWEIEFKILALALLLAIFGICVAVLIRIDSGLLQAVIRAGIFFIAYVAGVCFLKRKELQRAFQERKSE